MRWVLLLAIAACSSTHGTGPGSGTGPGGGPGGPGGGPSTTSNAKTCDDVRPRVEQLYRAEAQAHEPKRVEEAVADNTAMVMTDCAKDPAKTVPCLARAGSVAEVEKQCLVPLDDEGSEGAALVR